MRYWFAVIIAAMSLPINAAPWLRIMSPSGLGAVRIGMRPGEVEHALGGRLRLTFPDDDGPEGCAVATRYDKPDPAVSYMFEGGHLTRIDVGGSKAVAAVRTVRGIGVGASVAAVRRAYGGRIAITPNPYDERGQDIGVAAPGGLGLLFEAHDGRVTALRAGREPSVGYIEHCL